jgi:hypothetical protein
MNDLMRAFQQAGVPYGDDTLKMQMMAEFIGNKGMDEFIEFVKSYVEAHPEKVYRADYGDSKMCECGHPYYRHFDGYEDNLHVGCKYCSCYDFVLLTD